MKLLMVADFYPWPPTTGSHLRTATTIEGLADMGEVDLFSFYDARQPRDPVPTSLGLRRVAVTPHGPLHETLLRRLSWVARRDLPIEVAMRNGQIEPRTAFDSWHEPAYELVWFRSAAIYHWLGRPRLGPTVVDIDDLVDEKERQRAALVRRRPVGDVVARTRRAGARAQAELNAHDWGRFQRSVASGVDRVVLASEADIAPLGVTNADVLLNTYEQPDHPVGRAVPNEPPTVLFQGTFDYGPNIDGARWLATEIAPQIRERLPEARIRLVGKTTPSVEAVADPPRVTVTGRVPRMEPELAKADLVAVPLRMGSGTRLKILEAFAHRIPVVSTRLGAEGLAVEDGVHLLLADDADSFADACARVVSDLELRRSLVDAAERCFQQRYESKVARARVHEIVTSLTGAR